MEKEYIEDAVLEKLCQLNWTDEIIPRDSALKFEFQLNHFGIVKLRNTLYPADLLLRHAM